LAQVLVIRQLSWLSFSIERIRSLTIRARKLLYELDYLNVEIKFSDGTNGWAEESPFDAIIVTAGAPDIPQPLIDQLSAGGRLVIPVGDPSVQELIRIRKREDGIEREDLGGCRFVKLIGKYGWNDAGNDLK
jgi:protein-L-isoaspartate(D-aspartate) O-methyltransferase